MEPSNRKRMGEIVDSHVTEDEKKELPPVTTIKIDAVTPLKKHYKGTFTYHVPTLGDRVDISRMRAEYLGQTKVVEDDDGVNLAEMLAYLHTTIEDKDTNPEWWTGSKRGIDLYDYSPIVTLYAAARAYEATFLGGTTDVTDSQEEDGGEPGAVDPGDLERDVPPSPERRTIVEIDGKGGVGAHTSVSRDRKQADGTE